MPGQRLSLNDSLWVSSDSIAVRNLHTRVETDAVRERGARVFNLKFPYEKENLEALRKLVWQSDRHVILSWLHPYELKSFYPIFRERKNFSIILDDWWIIPHWFIREAEYKVFRKYNGIAVRLGKTDLVTETPPLVTRPEPIVKYSVAAAALHWPVLALGPFVDFYRQLKRENVAPEKLFYLPFPVVAEALPLKDEELKYDFCLTASTCGVWMMRDAYAPFKYAFANLYYDRQRLMDGISMFAGNPFKVYDWRRLDRPRTPVSWEEYIQLTRQSRFIVATGGLHNAAVAKYAEYLCLGTPMIGRALPFEYPWLDDCLFPVNVLRLTPGPLKPLLHEALERYPVFRENCLKWRARILELYEMHRLLDMLQAQADGQPISPGYLKMDLKNPSAPNPERA